ncbi:MAG: PEP-CTERM sorting domain-containing protein [Verrucomicrobiota bacterium]
MKKQITIPFLILILMSSSLLMGQTALNFNAAGDFSNSNFLISTPSYSQDTGTNGLSSSGSVKTNAAADSISIYKNQTTDFSQSGTSMVGLYFYLSPTTMTTANLKPVSVLFASNNTTTPSNALSTNLLTSVETSNPYVRLSLLTTTTDNTFNLRLYNSSSSLSEMNQSTSASTLSLTDGNWYYLQLDASTSGSSIALSGSLYNSDSTGILGSSILSISNTFTNTSLAADSSVYFGFGGQNATGVGINNMDNFTLAVPEPTTYAMIGMLSALIGFLVFRKIYIS